MSEPAPAEDSNFSPSSASRTTNSLGSDERGGRPARGRGSRGGKVPGNGVPKRKGRPRGSKNKPKPQPGVQGSREQAPTLEHPVPEDPSGPHLPGLSQLRSPSGLGLSELPSTSGLGLSQLPSPSELGLPHFPSPSGLSLSHLPSASGLGLSQLASPSLDLSQLPSPTIPPGVPANTPPSLTRLLASPSIDSQLPPLGPTVSAPHQPAPSFIESWPVFSDDTQDGTGPARRDSANYVTLKGVNYREQLLMLARK